MAAGKISLTLVLALAVLGAQSDGHQLLGGSEVFRGMLKTLEFMLTPHHSDDEERIALPRDWLLEDTSNKIQKLKNDFIDRVSRGERYDPDANAFFKILPKFVGALEMGKRIEFEDPCFKTSSAMANKNDDGTVTVTISLADADSLFCRTALLISVDADTRVTEYFFDGEKEVVFNAPESEADTWDLYDRGPRLFVFPYPIEKVIANLASTLALFEPCVTVGVGNTFAKLNLDFLRNYAGIEMPERKNAPEVMPIDKNLVHSGDTFHIMRLDGLDPMIAWAMGSATGHVAMALWRDDELFLCESNALSPYWPVNGIQCNAFEAWMEYGRRNDYNVVWAPIASEFHDTFDEDAAWQFIDSHLGVDYGWEVVLMGYLDSHDGNRICADTAHTMCTSKEHWEAVFSVAEKIADVAARVFKPAMMQRAGVDFNLPIVEAYYSAFINDGINPNDLHIIPENDTWIYPTLRNGEPFDSDVSICNVFTCKVHRAAGVFGDFAENINCGEFSVNDNYRMKIYATDFERPAECVAADPENPLCQVLGKYSLRLDSQPGIPPRYNYVDLHDNYGDNCPSEAPEYLAPTDC